MTAETAAALPVLVLLLVVAAWGLSAGASAVAAADAARAAARELARGEADDVAREAALRRLPGADVTLMLTGDEAVVRVRHVVRGSGLASFLAVPVGAEARARVEAQDVPAPGAWRPGVLPAGVGADL